MTQIFLRAGDWYLVRRPGGGYYLSLKPQAGGLFDEKEQDAMVDILKGMIEYRPIEIIEHRVVETVE